jgi:hypothetical protein
MRIDTNDQVEVHHIPEEVQFGNKVIKISIISHLEMIASYLDKLQLNSSNLIAIIEAKGELVRLNKKINKL